MTFTSDTDWLAEVLSDGREHELASILRRSFDERGYGLTVHSRAADLRKRGFTVSQRSERDGRRVRSFYRLASLEEAASLSPRRDDGDVRAWDTGAASSSEAMTAAPPGVASLVLFDLDAVA